MRIGIMSPDLNANTAAGSDAVGMFGVLRKAGFDVSLFTLNGVSSAPWEVLSYSDIDWKLQSSDDLLVYHHCMSDPLALTLIRRARCRLVMKYHSTAPSHFMAPYSAELTADARGARFMLDDFLALPVELYVGNSTYELDEVVRLADGQRPTRVLAPFPRVAALVASPGDGHTAAFLARHSVNLLNVGPVIPSGGHEDMLQALAEYNLGKRDRPHLHIVGAHDGRLGGYIEHLRRRISDLGLAGQVTFHGNVGLSVLASFYRHSQIYWTGSRHEGSCVPVIEAMAFGLPVLSSGVGALTEVCGGTAALADEPSAMAQSLEAMLEDDEQLVRFRRASLARFASKFTHDRLSRDLLSLMDELRKGVIAHASDVQPSQLDWFGLPDAVALVEDALALQPPVSAATLHSRDARLNLIRWMLEEGHRRSTVIKASLASDAFRNFAAGIAVPAPASHLSPAARLAWFVTPAAQELFRLTDAGSVRDYTRWFWREAVPTMALAPLMTPAERTFPATPGDTGSADRAAPRAPSPGRATEGRAQIR